jgi:signal transduction histidine kinase
MTNVVDFPLTDRPVTESEIDKLHSQAFRDLEPEICDCTSMAKIATQMVTEKDDGSDRELIFAVVHVLQMLDALKAGYYAAWHNEKPPESSE